jgi:hypothetical protein
MKRSLISFRTLLMSIVIFIEFFLGSCAEHNTYRFYDDYYHDWDAHKQSYYVQWENESHRDHRDFKKRSSDEQSDYWKWRHSHQDKDKDHDNR